MPTIPAVVTWDTSQNKGTVADIVVPAQSGETTITWTCGPDVASFTITGLDPNEFSPSSSAANVTTFTTTDKDDQAQDYSYFVEATRASTGETSRHDPKITNEP